MIGGRKSIDPGLATALVDQKQILMDYYHPEETEFDYSKNEVGMIETVAGPAFFCDDVEALLGHVAQERNVDLNDCMIKFSIDKGHDKLKVGINVIESESMAMEMPQAKRARYEDGIAPALYKSTSANRMQIVAMVPFIQESYNNLKKIMDNLPGRCYT